MSAPQPIAFVPITSREMWAGWWDDERGFVPLTRPANIGQGYRYEPPTLPYGMTDGGAA